MKHTHRITETKNKKNNEMLTKPIRNAGFGGKLKV